MSSELWRQLRSEAEQVIRKEPLLASYVYACVLNHKDLQSSLSFILANKLSDDVMPVVTVRELFEDAYAASAEIIECAVSDILAVFERDPAVNTFLPVILYLKGFQGDSGSPAGPFSVGGPAHRPGLVHSESQFRGFRRRYPSGLYHGQGQSCLITPPASSSARPR